MSSLKRELELAAGAVILPSLRPGGARIEESYLARFPPTGVIVFRGSAPRGGEPEELLESLRARCRDLGLARPFACCDLEQGAGLHFQGGTRLPPALALAAAEQGALDRGEATAGRELLVRAGELTGSEARSFGVELVLAPVVDVNTACDNPIIAVRSFGDRADDVVRRARAFVEGLHRGGAGACLKHFPGHGDTRIDSHLALARIGRSKTELFEIDLAPYRALREVDCVMVGHLCLADGPSVPATLDPAWVRSVLCQQIGFSGCVLTDAMDMGGVLKEERRYARALAAGCDGLLCPHDAEAAAGELMSAVQSGELEPTRLLEAAGAVRTLRDRLGARPASRGPLAGEGFSRESACAALCTAELPWPWSRGSACSVVEMQAERSLGSPARLRDLLRGEPADPRAPIAMVGEGAIGAGIGSAGFTQSSAERLERAMAAARAEGRALALVWFGSPQALPRELAAGIPWVCGFAPSPPMVEAVARFLRGEIHARGSLPLRLR
jgi:beta-glucosidase-like glycosyl hydrolase